jgi:16S rRNA (uracil1498-N3)-methyltransferase
MKAIPRVYLSHAAPGDRRVLGRSRSHHLSHVLRLAPGAPITVFDGEGGEYEARLEGGERGEARIAVGPAIREEAPPALAITLVPAISRATRMEWTLEKAVELGAAAIQPVFTARSKVRLDSTRAARRLEHWQGVVVAAASQCGRARLPRLSAPIPLGEALAAIDTQRIALLPEADSALTSLPAPQACLAILVGPEGGFETAEKDRIAAAGWQAVRLGPRTLRTETAGPAALAAVQALWGDWRS